MNNYERYEAIEDLLAQHTARELAGMVLDALAELKRMQDNAESWGANLDVGNQKIKALVDVYCGDSEGVACE